ncbi:right-handed parallel beta-helix repeat-containing protein [Candidatus Micrarchaeota archaeon]|nr:right-handed parallel beta-helix repeat-containing protein [Candidatus Micrarchaeota archaeon]
MAGKAHLKYAAAILILLASALLFFSLPKELTDGFFLFLEARQAPANYAAAVLEFNFSKNDLRSFAMEGAATDSRKVQLKAKNSLHDVEISNYSDSQKSAIPQRPSFTIQFNDEFFRENRLRTFRLFPQEGFSPDEIAPIYALADELGIHSLGSEAATLKINGVNYHSYFLKPQYDADSLEYIGAPGSMVFKAADSKSRFTYVASAFEMPGASEHLTNFFILADAMDPNILVKYFDFDYLARYEALRELLGAQEGFMLSRDTLFLYNSANGKIYPIFDEANVKNINSKNSGAMAYLSEKISGNKYIGALKQNYLHELAASPVAQQLSSSPSKFIPSNFTATLAQYKNRPPAPTPAFSPVEKYLSSPSAYLDEMATMPEIPATKTPAKIADEAGVSALLADAANSILNGEKPQWLASSSLLGSSCLSSPHSGCWLQIADMEDNSTWACYGNGCGITPSHFKEGKNGYHVPAASTAYSYITAIDLGSHDHISVWVYANQSGGQMHIALGSGASAKFYYTFIPSAGWNHISAPKSDFAKAGSANWSAISYIEAINSQPNSFAIFDDLRAIMQGSQFGAEQELPAFVPESGVWELQKGDLGPLVAGLEPKGEGILQYNKYIGSNALHMLRVNLNYGELAGYQMGDFFVGIHSSGEIGCTSKGKASNSSYIGAAAHDWVDLLLVSNSSFVAAYYKTTLMGSFALLCNAPYYPNGKVRLKHIGERQLFDGLAVYEPYPEEYEQMRLVQSNGNFIVPRGNYYINGTFFLPAGKTLEIEKGTKICLAKNSSLVSYGNVQALGTQESPILIRPCLPSEKFGVFAIVGPNQGTSNIQYLDISGGSEAYIKGAYFSGALSIYYADASISNSKIHHNNADDGLNVKHSKVSINASEFYSNFADSADLDFCEGSVKDSVFSPKIYKKGKPPEYAPLDINGDGLDISGSHLLVQNNSFFGMLDKGMSIGENSYAALLSNSFRSNRLGVAVKDLSHVLFVGNSVSSNTVAMSAYRKKEIFGGGKIYSVANKFFENQKTYELDRNSQLFTLEKEPGLQDILASADKNAISSLFSLLAADSNSSQNNVLSFKVGATDARIDKNAKIIFASLPLGPQPMQTISYELENNAAQVSIAPISIGANAPFFGNETLLENNATYDFGGYIFTGTVIFKTCSRNGTCQNDFFSLYVTTGDVPLLELNTMNEFGSPLPIFDEQDTPVSLRIISQNKNDSDSGLQGFIGTRGFQLGEKRKYACQAQKNGCLKAPP